MADPNAQASTAVVSAAAFSLEATRPTLNELRELAGVLEPATRLYLSAVAKQSMVELAATATQVRQAGLEPVPHVAARRLASATALKGLLKQLREEADVRRLLIIGGDRDSPEGPFHDALAVIRGGALRQAGIEEIGLAGYPDGHPRIAAEEIEQALDAKIAAASIAGLRVYIVSQFCFDPPRIVAWLRRLRAGGIRQPVEVGVVGPTSLPSLLRFAARCGVRTSARALLSGTAGSLLGQVAPDEIIAALTDAGAAIGEVSPHYFSFGGSVRTARYAREMAQRQSAARRAIDRERQGPAVRD